MTRIALMASMAVVLMAHHARPSGPAEARKAAREDLKKLQGTWTLVAMEQDGETVPADEIKGRTVVYEDDHMTLMAGDVPRRRGIITLDPSRTPKAMNTWDIDGPFSDRTVSGIYALDGDTLKLCFARPGEDRPTEFTAKRGTAFLSCVYRRKAP